jgi:hypothetical protein
MLIAATLAAVSMPAFAQTAKDKAAAVMIVGQTDPVTVTGMVQVAPPGTTPKAQFGTKRSMISMPGASAGQYNRSEFFGGPIPAGAVLVGLTVTVSAGPSETVDRYCSALVQIAPALGTVTNALYAVRVHAGETAVSGYVPLPNIVIPEGEGVMSLVNSDQIPCSFAATAYYRVP